MFIQIKPEQNHIRIQTALEYRKAVNRGIGQILSLRQVTGGLGIRGKRGALRTIYYWDRPDTIYMIFMYKKTVQADLTPQQLKVLKKLVEESLL